MKKHFLILLSLCCLGTMLAQDFSTLEDITFKNKEDYKVQEPLVLKCANFFLASPLSENYLDKNKALGFIMRWMEGTPDYHFGLGMEFVELTKGDMVLPSAFMAALAKAAITGNYADSNKQMEAGIKIFIDYCKDPKNKVKHNKAIKKYLKKHS